MIKNNNYICIFEVSYENLISLKQGYWRLHVYPFQICVQLFFEVVKQHDFMIRVQVMPISSSWKNDGSPDNSSSQYSVSINRKVLRKKLMRRLVLL